MNSLKNAVYCETLNCLNRSKHQTNVLNVELIIYLYVSAEKVSRLKFFFFSVQIEIFWFNLIVKSTFRMWWRQQAWPSVFRLKIYPNFYFLVLVMAFSFIAVLLILYAIWDLNYFLRCVFTLGYAHFFQKKRKVTEKTTVYSKKISISWSTYTKLYFNLPIGFCTTNDVDIFIRHMNNARWKNQTLKNVLFGTTNLLT